MGYAGLMTVSRSMWFIRSSSLLKIIFGNLKIKKWHFDVKHTPWNTRVSWIRVAEVVVVAEIAILGWWREKRERCCWWSVNKARQWQVVPGVSVMHKHNFSTHHLQAIHFFYSLARSSGALRSVRHRPLLPSSVDSCQVWPCVDASWWPWWSTISVIRWKVGDRVMGTARRRWSCQSWGWEMMKIQTSRTSARSALFTGFLAPTHDNTIKISRAGGTDECIDIVWREILKTDNANCLSLEGQTQMQSLFLLLKCLYGNLLRN